jgi:hypothetical protein
MKVRLNKAVLSEMDSQVREVVAAWKARYGKAFISVENRPSFYTSEDARVTMLNLFSGVSQTAQAAGAFAGATKLSPCAEVPLPSGTVAIVEEFFCGTPYLTIYQSSPKQVAA